MSKCDYAGIDYGRGMSNVDGSTGIRYGVIHHREVGQAWAEESEANYGEIMCSMCGDPVTMDMDKCPNCEADMQDSFDNIDPVSFSYDQDGYACEQGYDDPDIFIIKSPYYTWCQYCSPCAPGAGYVMNWMEPGKGIKAYCFGPDFFEDNKAPYPVYRVDTDELVEV